MPDTLPRPPASRPELSFETRMTQAGRASLGPAAVNAVLGGLTRGFLPGRGTGYNLGVAGGNLAVNVAGQALVPTIVAKREGILNEPAYNRVGDIDSLDTEPGYRQGTVAAE